MENAQIYAHAVICWVILGSEALKIFMFTQNLNRPYTKKRFENH